MTKTSAKFWGLTAAGVLALDAVIVKLGYESLSQCYTRSLEKPSTGIPVAITTMYLLLHLCGFGKMVPLFAKVDPLHQAAERLLR